MFCRRHESPDVYFMRSQRRRFSFLFGTCEYRFRWRCLSVGLEERWLCLQQDSLAVFSSIMDHDPTDMFFFDTSFSLFRDDDGRVLVCGASWVLEIYFGESRNMSHSSAQNWSRQGSAQSWVNAITLTAQLSKGTKEQRFGSFAPIRNPALAKVDKRQILRHSFARFFIDGCAAFRHIAEAILMAKHEVFLLGWWISPHLPLVRGDDSLPLPGNADPRLSALLRGAAARGVRIYILIWHETLLPNDSEWTETQLSAQGIYIVRHRSRFDINLLWSHHEKVVVVDQQFAFLGGLDLCYGRYDDPRHRLDDDSAEATSHMWVEKDYSNPRIKDFVDVRSAGDMLDRAQQPRMPWNHAKTKKPEYASLPTALLRRHTELCNEDIAEVVLEEADAKWPPEYGAWHECSAQVVRSVGQWSAGTRTESSVHAAYCELILSAERFIYIENQFFCSGMEGDSTIGNRVVGALFQRVLKAHADGKEFHVMIVLPLLPALDDNIDQLPSPLMYVMHWQYRTLRAFRSQLVDAGVDFSHFVSVFGLRTHGRLHGAGVVTEEIYVHSKLMVVDDQRAIIGSANLNDRSLLGMRDSEVCIVLRDAVLTHPQLTPDAELDRAALGYASAPSGPFSRGLRTALLAQHLGWSKEEAECTFADPLSEASLGEIRRVAQSNTQIYEELFGVVPSDLVRSWEELAARRERAGRLSGDSMRVPSESEAAGDLAKVQGHLVEFPLDFLIQEELAPSAMSKVWKPTCWQPVAFT